MSTLREEDKNVDLNVGSSLYDADDFFDQQILSSMLVKEETMCSGLYKNINCILFFTVFYFKKTYREINNLIITTQIRFSIAALGFILFPLFLLATELPRMYGYLINDIDNQDLSISILSTILCFMAIGTGIYYSKRLLKRIKLLKDSQKGCIDLALKSIEVQRTFHSQLYTDAANVYKDKDSIAMVKDELLFIKHYQNEFESVKRIYDENILSNHNFIYSAVSERIFNLHASFNGLMKQNSIISSIDDHIHDMNMLHNKHRDNLLVSIKEKKLII